MYIPFLKDIPNASKCSKVGVILSHPYFNSDFLKYVRQLGASEACPAIWEGLHKAGGLLLRFDSRRPQPGVSGDFLILQLDKNHHLEMFFLFYFSGDLSNSKLQSFAQALA